MDNLALVYESSTLVTPQTFRASLINDILHYHIQDKTAKRDVLLEYVTEAEAEYLVEQGLVHELFGGAPGQRGMMQSAADKVKGAFGGQESGTRNKLVEVYQQVWTEFMKYLKHLTSQANTQKGLGNKTGTGGQITPEVLGDFLLHVVKIGPKPINHAFKSVNIAQDAKQVLDQKTAGNIIYKGLQVKYQGTATSAAAYASEYKVPDSL